MIFEEYHIEPWYQQIRYQMEIRYYAIENRMIESFGFVTPDTDNRSVHSYVFASILRDAGSLFDSIIKKMIKETGKTYDDRIYGCLKFLEEHDPNIEKRTITMRSNLKILTPFIKIKDNLPMWWHAYNDVKHYEISEYKQGNLENALTSLAACAYLLHKISPTDWPSIFVNIGSIHSEDYIKKRLFFP